MPAMPAAPAAPAERTLRAALLVAVLAALCLVARGCDPEDSHSGCKIYGASCACGYGCKTEFVYRSRRDCLNALRDWNPNICDRKPCQRGICAQTTHDLGFACKCEGTGFYGKRCEKACPTIPMRGLVFPHECVVI